MRVLGRATLPAVRAIRAVGAGRGRPRLTIIGWHRFDDLPGGLSTPIDVFGAQLDALADWGAAVLPLEDCATLLAAGRLPPRAVALTFDDGYASVLETAWPMLRARGLPATLFVVTGYLDGQRRLPWDADRADAEQTRLSDIDDIRRAAADGLDVGSHSVTHRWLPHLTTADLEEELVGSRATLESELGRQVRSVAYPAGGWSRPVRRAAAAAGYAIGVTADRGVNSARQDRLALRRSMAPDTVEDFKLLLAGAYTWLRPVDTVRARKAARR